MNEHGGSSSEQPKNGVASTSELALQTASVVLSGSEFQSSTSTSQQTTKKRQGPFHGPSRALKYQKLRTVQPGKVKANIPPTIGVVVGERSNQFIAECAAWVREICPLNVPKWKDMPQNKLDQLYQRIQAKYDLGEGAHVQNAIKTQCSTLYRHWRERLKADYFSNCKSLLEAERNCPPTIRLEQWKWLIYNYWNLPKQRERSEKNRENANAKKIKSACGAKSIARTIYELELEAEVANQGEDEIDVNTSNDDPMYIKLWEKTKRWQFDDEAEHKLKEFRELHKKEIEENGSDKLTVEEAYERVLGYRSGYTRGLGKGHPVLTKDGKMRRVEFEQLQNENNIMLAELEASKKKQEDLERKFKLVMERIGLEVE